MAKSLSPAIQSELVKVVTTLHDILKGLDNEPLFTKIIETSLLLGNGDVYRNDVEALYWEAYPDINLMSWGLELKTLVYHLGQLLCGNHELIKSEIQSIVGEKEEKYYSLLRESIEQEVSSISHLFQDEVESVNLIGNLNE